MCLLRPMRAAPSLRQMPAMSIVETFILVSLLEAQVSFIDVDQFVSAPTPPKGSLVHSMFPYRNGTLLCKLRLFEMNYVVQSNILNIFRAKDSIRSHCVRR
jgi:hypothetical protein